MENIKLIDNKEWHTGQYIRTKIPMQLVATYI